MAELFTSDWHFHHKNIQKFTNRPWCAVNEIDKMIDHWNSQVSVNDVVWSLGDFTFLSGSQNHVLAMYDLLGQLNGCIHLLWGNHCHEKLWSRVEMPHITKEGHYKEIKRRGKKIVMSHYPMRSWNQQGRGSFHLYGHCHGSISDYGRSMDVGIDAHPEFKMFTLDEIFDTLGSRPVVVEDQHKITGE